MSLLAAPWHSSSSFGVNRECLASALSPGIGRPVVPSNHGQRFAVGHIVEEGRHLFVSSGVGTSILPVRFLVPPEVSLLTLRPAAP